MDNPSSSTRRQDEDTPQFPPLPNVMSKSTNISQSGSHRAATGPALQGRPSYAAVARKALSDQRLGSAAGASNPVAASRREPRPTTNQTTARPGAASRGRQVTMEHFNIKLDARSRAGKSPLDADNTRKTSAHIISSSSPSSISTSKETQAAQGERITNSETTMSAGSMQLLVHRVTNSPPSLNVLSSRALRENGSNTPPPVAAPGLEETRKRGESSRPQQDSRSQKTVIRPYAEQVDRTASIQPSPSFPSSPHFSSSETNATRPHAEPVDRSASSSVQPSTKLSTSYPPPLSSSERNATRPHPGPINRTASSSIKPPTKSATPPPPFLFSETNATRPHADPVNRTASSSVQPSIKYSTPSPPPFSSDETNATRPHAESVDRTNSIQPHSKPFIPSPLGQPSASISPSSSPPAPALAKIASNRMRPPRSMLSYEPQTQFSEALSEPPHLVDRGNVRSDEQACKDPSEVWRSPAPPEYIPATTRPPRQDHTDPSAIPHRPPEHVPTTTDLPSWQDRKVASATPNRPPIPAEHTPAATVSPSLQVPKGASAVPPNLSVLPKHTPVTTDPRPPSNSLSQPAFVPDDLSGSKSGIQENEGVGRGTEQAVEGSPSVREERNRVLMPEERENRLKGSANAKPKTITSHAQIVRQYSRTPSESSLRRTYLSYRSLVDGPSAPDLPDTNDSQRKVELSAGHSSEERDKPVPVQRVPMERHTGDQPRMDVAGGEPLRAQQHQAKPNPEGGNSVGILSSSPPDSDAGKSRGPDRPERSVGNEVDARLLPAQPLSGSISPQSGRSKVDKEKAQQKTGNGNTAKGSGGRVVRRKDSRNLQGQRPKVTSPAYREDRDDDRNPIVKPPPRKEQDPGVAPYPAVGPKKQSRRRQEAHSHDCIIC